MDIDFNQHSTVELLKITIRPELHHHAAVSAATEVLKARVITQEDLNEAKAHLEENDVTIQKSAPSSNALKKGRYSNEKWLNVILAIAILEYLHLLYTDIKSIHYVLSGQDYPYRIVTLGSYIDLLYTPFVFYMFYKRMRWGWITLFGIKLFTIAPSLLFYFKEYWPVERGFGLLTYPLLTIFLDIPIVVFLWKQDIYSIFSVTDKIRWVTVASIVLMLALLTCVNQYNYTQYAGLKSNKENQIKTIRKRPADTNITPRSKLLALIKAIREKPVDTTYMRTGLYFLTEKNGGIDMRLEKSDEIYKISPSPFVSVDNINKATLEESHFKEKDYTQLCMVFDTKGAKDLKNGTGNLLHPKIAVVIANKLLYVVKNTTSIKTGIMCTFLLGYTTKEMESMCDSVNAKR